MYPLPQYIQFYPTYRCNQKCSFCFNNSKNKILPDITYEKAIELINIISHIGVKEIDIMGGEPFLLPWMSEFITRAFDKGLTVNISTNGSYPDALKKLKGLSTKKFNIGISLEGSTAKIHRNLTGTGNFENIMISLKILQELNLNPLVKTVVSKDTMTDIQHIIYLLKNTGVKRYYLIHMDVFSRIETDIKNSLNYCEFVTFFEDIRLFNPDMDINKVNASCFNKEILPKYTRCAGGVKKLFIRSDGSAFPCNLFQDFMEFYLGNIFVDHFEKIWNNHRLEYFRNFTENRCVSEMCHNRDSCTGGCPAHGYYHYGYTDRIDIRCNQANI